MGRDRGRIVGWLGSEVAGIGAGVDTEGWAGVDTGGWAGVGIGGWVVVDTEGWAGAAGSCRSCILVDSTALACHIGYIYTCTAPRSQKSSLNIHHRLMGAVLRHCRPYQCHVFCTV